jgi:DNA invertase Pin-like site-specific DNA recombinase
MQPPRALVAYYRVSTDKQGASGLGLEGQHTCVTDYAAATQSRILASYQEVESGTRSDRPMLTKAIAHANRSGATLIIAKLDRLARNVHFLSGLMESGVDFIACDNPHANKLTIHILAAVAEDETQRISERTKAAMAVYKARGGVLGTPANLTPEAMIRGQRLGTLRVKELARAAYADLIPLMQAYRSDGASLRGIAKTLNVQGHTLRGGGPWTAIQVKRVLDRASRNADAAR